jgi:hypothetical protein
MEIETDGAARIEYASGIDKKQYFPYQTRTREQLRICCQHLDEFLTRLGNCIPESTNNSSQETTDKAASTRDRQASQNPNKLTDPTAMGNQTSSRLGITKAQALVAFGDLVKAINFANALEDVPQWIRDARVSKGTPGQRHKTIWCPVLLAITLHERQLVRKGQLTKVFFDHEFLKQWRQEWHEKSEYLS